MAEIYDFPLDRIQELNALMNRITAEAKQFGANLAVLVDALEKTNRNLETTCKMLAVVSTQLEDKNGKG